MPLSLVTALPHARNERIDVRDLELAVDCYRSVARALLGGEAKRGNTSRA